MVALALLPSASLDAPTRAVPLALPAPSRHGATGFARTKIRPPRRAATAGLISRPALDAQLTAALATQRLVLMSAAAGYGKTAALAQWSDRLPDDTAVAWVSADEGDDLQRLLECLTAALEPCDLPWRQAPETLLAQAASAWPGARSGAAATLINALDACRAARGVIVFDDLHRVTDPDFFEFLDLMLERLGERWTIAIATRSDPPLALARLRVRGELAEFRLDALGFRRDDVRRLAADTVQADALFERTQGWPAGVRIALQGAAGGAPPAAATA